MGQSNTPYRLRIRDLPEEEKPREKLKKYGPARGGEAEGKTEEIRASVP